MLGGCGAKLWVGCDDFAEGALGAKGNDDLEHAILGRVVGNVKFEELFAATDADCFEEQWDGECATSGEFGEGDLDV